MHTSSEASRTPGHAASSRLARWTLPLCLVAAILVLFAVGMAGWHKGTVVSLFFQGCDSFCYSEMAASIRTSRATDKPVDYFLRDDQSEFLIGKFRQSGLSEDLWREAISPHGYRYFRFSHEVGPQYPPGAPWALSFFPANNAIHGLNRASILLVAFIGLALAGWCLVRGLPFSCLVVTMATYTYLATFTWVDLASFSINATIFPLFAGIILAWFARERTRGVLAILLAFVGGLGVGLTMEDRIASLLLFPTLVPFFLPGRFALIAANVAGMMMGGIVPLLLHNKLVAGGYFLPTYDTGDTEQSLSCIWTNLLYYVHWWYQNSCVHVLILTVALVALVVLVRLTARAPAGHWRRWIRDRAGFILAPPVTFVIAASYFLTHKVTEGYYLTPSSLTIALTLALLFVSLEIEWRAVAPAASRRAPLWWTAIGLGVAGVAAAFLANLDDFADGIDGVLHPRPEEIVQFDLPPALQDSHAWLWADFWSGSIRFYTGHPAFKIFACGPDIRQRVYGWVKARGEPQYLVEDSETMRRLVDEARKAGWKLTLVGYIRDVPCFRMDAGP